MFKSAYLPPPTPTPHHPHLRLPPGGRGILVRVLPPVWNLRAASLITLFCIFSLVLLPSPVTISVLSFSAFGPFSWPDLFFPKPLSFERWALLCGSCLFWFEQLIDEYLSWWYVQPMLPYGTDISLYAFM